jgi:hypothetical protein
MKPSRMMPTTWSTSIGFAGLMALYVPYARHMGISGDFPLIQLSVACKPTIREKIIPHNI